MGRHTGINTVTQINTHLKDRGTQARFVMHVNGIGGPCHALRHANPWIHEQHSEHYALVVCTRTQRLQPARL